MPDRTIGDMSSATVRTASGRRTAAQPAFWAAVSTAVFAGTAFAAGITTPPRSGPYCTSSCVGYPYTDVAAFVPRDYLWMYPGILAVVALVVLFGFIQGYVEVDKKTLAQIGLCFASISAVLIAADYFIQLAVMQPSLVKGETQNLSLFSQYNPHGIFVALEDLGYVMMSVAFLFAGAALAGRSRLEQAVRWILVVSSAAAFAALVVMSIAYGSDLEYRFEVAVLSINWSVLVVAGVMLSVLFRRVGRAQPIGE
jgi:hypothetical protein